MITRDDYLDNDKPEATHEAYYGQFVTPTLRAFVKSRIGNARILKSTDPHMNDIPLAKWDALMTGVYNLVGDLMVAAGDIHSYTLASCNCAAKAAARDIQNYPANAEKMATLHGFDILHNQGTFDHTVYVKGDFQVWSIGSEWQTANLIDGRFCHHSPQPTLHAALTYDGDQA